MLGALSAIFLMVGCSLQAYNPDTGNFSITIQLPDYLASKQVANGRLIHPDAEVLEATISTASGSIVATVKQSLGGKDTITLNFDDVPKDEVLKLKIEVYVEFTSDNGSIKQILGTHESTFGPLKAGVNNLKVGIVPDPDFINGYLEDDGDSYWTDFDDIEDYIQNQIFKLTDVSKGLWYINWIDESGPMDSDPTVSVYTSEGLLLAKNLTKVEAANGSDYTYKNYFFYNTSQEDLYLLARNMPQDTEELNLYIELFDQDLVLTYPGDDDVIFFVEEDEPIYLGLVYLSAGQSGPLTKSITIHNPYPFAITLTNDALIKYEGYTDGSGDNQKPNPNAFSIVDATLPINTTIPAGGKKEFTVQYAPTVSTFLNNEEATLTLNFDNNITYTCTLSGSACN